MVYHGSTAIYLRHVLHQGIRPRSIWRQGNFDGELASNPDYAYLTTAYPIFYADGSSPNMDSVVTLGTKGIGRVIYEVDPTRLDMTSLRPDEDFLRQYMHCISMLDSDSAFAESHSGRMPTSADKERLRAIVDAVPCGRNLNTDDPEQVPHLWSHSAQLLGSFALRGGVPRTAIVRYAIIDPRRAPSLMVWGISMQLNIEQHAYGIQRDIGLALVRLIFNNMPLPHMDLSSDISPHERESLVSRVWISEAAREQAHRERQVAVKVYDCELK